MIAFCLLLAQVGVAQEYEFGVRHMSPGALLVCNLHGMHPVVSHELVFWGGGLKQ